MKKDEKEEIFFLTLIFRVEENFLLCLANLFFNLVNIFILNSESNI